MSDWEPEPQPGQGGPPGGDGTRTEALGVLVELAVPADAATETVLDQLELAVPTAKIDPDYAPVPMEGPPMPHRPASSPGSWCPVTRSR